MLVSHRAGRNPDRTVVERAHQRVDFGVQPGLCEFLRESPQLPASGQRRMVVQVHRVRVVAGLAFVLYRDHLSGFGVVAEPG